MRLLAAVVLVACISSAGSSACRADGKSTIVDVKRHRVCLVLDPTVTDAQWTRRIVDSLTGRIGENSELILWIVKTGAIAEGAPIRFEFPFDPKRRTSDLAPHTKRASEETWALFQKHWNAASASSRVPQSCILTALYQVSQYLQERNDTSSVDTDLVVASDLLEACREWEAPVNLERGLLETATVISPAVERAVSLAGVKNTALVLAPHKTVDTPAEVEHLRMLWNEGLKQLGASAPRVITDIGSAVLSRERAR